MKRKTFIKIGSTLMASTILSPTDGFSFDQQERLKNWAGNITYSTDNVFYPKTIEAIQQLVKDHTKIKALGTKHCFNRIADSSNNLISTSKLNKVLSLDTANNTVTVEAGIKYGELAPYLNDKGFALHNLASLPHISVGGSIATATHGSGIKNGNLSSAVVGLEVVTADGQVVNFSKELDAEKFNAVVVGLGAIGISTKVTLKVKPTYQVRQYVFTGMPIAQLKNNFEKIMSSGYSVSLFTDWQTDLINEVWIKSRLDDGNDHSSKKPSSYHRNICRKLYATNGCSRPMV
jgi:xylitol oxidase